MALESYSDGLSSGHCFSLRETTRSMFIINKRYEDLF